MILNMKFDHAGINFLTQEDQISIFQLANLLNQHFVKYFLIVFILLLAKELILNIHFKVLDFDFHKFLPQTQVD